MIAAKAGQYILNAEIAEVFAEGRREAALRSSALSFASFAFKRNEPKQHEQPPLTFFARQIHWTKSAMDSFGVAAHYRGMGVVSLSKPYLSGSGFLGALHEREASAFSSGEIQE